MARPVATQELVTAAAESVLAEGGEPSILTVQARIGGGSYSTVKRYLDLWRQQRQAAEQAAPPLPAELEARALDFARGVWGLAASEAQQLAQQARDEASSQVLGVRQELAEARNEIGRLEAIETELATQLEQGRALLREHERALAEAQGQLLRVAELEQTLGAQRAELATAHQGAMEQALAVGRLTGEAEALRTQVRELMATLKPNTRRG